MSTPRLREPLAYTVYVENFESYSTGLLQVSCRGVKNKTTRCSDCTVNGGSKSWQAYVPWGEFEHCGTNHL
jgi:hypothetical protein